MWCSILFWILTSSVRILTLRRDQSSIYLSFFSYFGPKLTLTEYREQAAIGVLSLILEHLVQVVNYGIIIIRVPQHDNDLDVCSLDRHIKLYRVKLILETRHLEILTEHYSKYLTWVSITPSTFLAIWQRKIL